MANKKKKVVSAIAAVATSAALLLGGTLAWQSANQVALNEASDVINPGGRLHDDFDGENKDVYVENFTDPNNGGEDIFARIRLEEYFEIITNYDTQVEKVHDLVGTATDAPDKTNPVTGNYGDEQGAEYERIYKVFTFDDVSTDDNGVTTVKAAVGEDGASWWTWTLGGQTTYMPTFNLNKDSLMADVNGLFNGEVGVITDKDGHQYDEIGNGGLVSKLPYVDYTKTENASKDGYEVFDGDPNNIDELVQQGLEVADLADIITNGTGSAAYTGLENSLELSEIQLTHNVEQTAVTDRIMSMAEWKALPENEQVGAYWVYDTDGWVYWAQPIEPGETTGLLLDGIQLNQVMDDTWYYAINVVAQFVTADDVGKFEGTGFYDDEKGSAPTGDAEALLEKIGVNMSGEPSQPEEEEPQYDLILTFDGSDRVSAATKKSFTVGYDETGLTQDQIADTTGIKVYQEVAPYTRAIGAELTADQYTYEADGSLLTLTDDTLTGILRVTDLNGVLYGFIDISEVSEAPELTTELALRGDWHGTMTEGSLDWDADRNAYVYTGDAEQVFIHATNVLLNNESVTNQGEEFHYFFESTGIIAAEQDNFGNGSFYYEDADLNNIIESSFWHDFARFDRTLFSGEQEFSMILKYPFLSDSPYESEPIKIIMSGIASQAPEYTELKLEANGSIIPQNLEEKAVNVSLNENLKLTTDVDGADFSSIVIALAEPTGIPGKIVFDQDIDGVYTYEDGILTITDETLPAGTIFMFYDGNGAVSGAIRVGVKPYTVTISTDVTSYTVGETATVYFAPPVVTSVEDGTTVEVNDRNIRWVVSNGAIEVDSSHVAVAEDGSMTLTFPLTVNDGTEVNQDICVSAFYTADDGSKCLSNFVTIAAEEPVVIPTFTVTDKEGNVRAENVAADSGESIEVYQGDKLYISSSDPSDAWTHSVENGKNLANTGSDGYDSINGHYPLNIANNENIGAQVTVTQTVNGVDYSVTLLVVEKPASITSVTAVSAEENADVTLDWNTTSIQYTFASTDGSIANPDAAWAITGYNADGNEVAADVGMTIAADADGTTTATVTHTCAQGSCTCAAEYYVVSADDVDSGNKLYLNCGVYTSTFTPGEAFIAEDGSTRVPVTVAVYDENNQAVTLADGDLTWDAKDTTNGTGSYTDQLEAVDSSSVTAPVPSQAMVFGIGAEYTAPNGYVFNKLTNGTALHFHTISLTPSAEQYSTGTGDIVTVTPAMTTYKDEPVNAGLLNDITWKVTENDIDVTETVLTKGANGLASINTASLTGDITVTACYSNPANRQYAAAVSTTIAATEPVCTISILPIEYEEEGETYTYEYPGSMRPGDTWPLAFNVNGVQSTDEISWSIEQVYTYHETALTEGTKIENDAITIAQDELVFDGSFNNSKVIKITGVDPAGRTASLNVILTETGIRIEALRFYDASTGTYVDAVNGDVLYTGTTYDVKMRVQDSGTNVFLEDYLDPLSVEFDSLTVTNESDNSTDVTAETWNNWQFTPNKAGDYSIIGSGTADIYGYIYIGTYVTVENPPEYTVSLTSSATQYPVGGSLEVTIDADINRISTGEDVTPDANTVSWTVYDSEGNEVEDVLTVSDTSASAALNTSGLSGDITVTATYEGCEDSIDIKAEPDGTGDPSFTVGYASGGIIGSGYAPNSTVSVTPGTEVQLYSTRNSTTWSVTGAAEAKAGYNASSGSAGSYYHVNIPAATYDAQQITVTQTVDSEEYSIVLEVEGLPFTRLTATIDGHTYNSSGSGLTVYGPSNGEALLTAYRDDNSSVTAGLSAEVEPYGGTNVSNKSDGVYLSYEANGASTIRLNDDRQSSFYVEYLSKARLYAPDSWNYDAGSGYSDVLSEYLIPSATENTFYIKRADSLGSGYVTFECNPHYATNHVVTSVTNNGSIDWEAYGITFDGSTMRIDTYAIFGGTYVVTYTYDDYDGNTGLTDSFTFTIMQWEE